MTVNMEEMTPHVERAAGLMEMLSQPMRLKVLCELLGGEKNVTDLCSLSGLSQPAMSHHLRKLRDSGLVATRRDGQAIFYSLQGPEVQSVLEVLYDLYCPIDKKEADVA
ncbi:MAG: ArsR/SmtB family transcription factor [Brevirhabdus sp.]